MDVAQYQDAPGRKATGENEGYISDIYISGSPVSPCHSMTLKDVIHPNLKAPYHRHQFTAFHSTHPDHLLFVEIDLGVLSCYKLLHIDVVYVQITFYISLI